jgi:DNA-binding beta-propeller fold protein YncE
MTGIRRGLRVVCSVGMMVGAITVGLVVGGATAALANTHPLLRKFGSFRNPNGIAVEEANGDVYVADVSTDTVYRFDGCGNPVEYAYGGECATYVKGKEMTGSPAGSLSFPAEMPCTPGGVGSRVGQICGNGRRVIDGGLMGEDGGERVWCGGGSVS